VAGRIELSFEPIDFCAVVREIAERFADEAQRNKVRLDVDAPGPLIGQWDANALDQIITNIVSNAIKYGRENPVEIWAGQRDGLATLVVRDHGIGIAPEDQERVFGRFERAVSSRNYGGFGLGLWIAQQGAEAMGGRISVKSSLGQGAEFTLELPVERRERA
jgi:two-component system OmpR family sensor kinase